VCTTHECESTLTRFVWAGDQLLWELRVPGGNNVTGSALDETNVAGAMYGRVSYFHAGGIDRPLLITKEGVESVVPRETWRCQFHAGTSPTTGASRNCPIGVQMGLPVSRLAGGADQRAARVGGEQPESRPIQACSNRKEHGEMMSIRIPRTAWPLVLPANLSYLLVIPLYGLWITRVTRGNPNGFTDADSIGLPAEALTTQLLLGLPIVNFLLWIVLRRYPGPVELFQRVAVRGLRTGVAEAVFLALIIGMSFLVLDSVLNTDWEFVGVGIVWLYLLLCSRTVVLARLVRGVGVPVSASPEGRSR
jgi:hypothetical protein